MAAVTGPGTQPIPGEAQGLKRPRVSRQSAAAALMAVAAVLWWLSFHVPALSLLPEGAVLQLGAWLNGAVNFVLREFTVAGVTLSEASRAVAGVFAAPVTWVTESLTEGHYYELPDGSEFWLAPLPWFGLAAILLVSTHAIGGRGPAVLAAATIAYVIACGLWVTTIVTLVAVLFSVVVCFAAGLGLGIWAHRSPTAATILEPIYDSLQTVPVFSYMSIIVVLFGFGPVAGLVATVIFAMPPMARATQLALSQVPPELSELAKIAGCTPTQKLWLVDLPSRARTLLLGVNQVIMLSLAMVIITSVIGAGGLGGDVIKSLRSMRMTEALLAGLAITLIAIVLDRATVAWARKPRQAATGAPRYGRWIAAIFACSIVVTLAAPDAGVLPDRPIVGFGRSLDRMLDAFNLVAAPYLKVMQDAITTYGLRPMREFFSGLPWAAAVAGVAALGMLAGGARLSLTVGLLLLSLAVLGLWPKAMLSLYLVLASLAAAFVAGLPLGIWAGLNDRFFRVAAVAADVIQTLPTFVYLIPVVTLFGVGDFSAFLAIVIFMIAPIVRYTAAGLQQVPLALSDAAIMSGCTTFQRLRMVLLPMSMPQLLLGLNQAVMLGFSMLVITSLVGSRGLEETTLVAISKVRPGDGLVAGFGIAVLAIVVDRLLRGASRHVEERYFPRATGGH